MKLTAENYYVLICSDAKYAPKDKVNRIICGVFASKKEAQELKEEIKDCPLPHLIKKCKVTVEI